jgi:hypothetical protein
MGRGRGKGTKQTAIATREDPGSGEEEKIPAYRRRGRPQKPLKDEIEEEDEDVEKIAEDGEDAKGNISRKDVKNQGIIANRRKRKRSAQVKENTDTVGVESGIGTKASPDDPTKSAGLRQNGSRRKSKPRRAAEAGVECK